jgi:hypothetical protein
MSMLQEIPTSVIINTQMGGLINTDTSLFGL